MTATATQADQYPRPSDPRDLEVTPPAPIGAGCGVFAGLFLGGCAGALAGSRALEQVQHDRLHRARSASGDR
jgi:hypothetical protein